MKYGIGNWFRNYFFPFFFNQICKTFWWSRLELFLFDYIGIYWIINLLKLKNAVDSDYFWRKPMIDGEPWIVSGGSVSDLLKLLFVTPNIMDLITLKSVIPLFLNCLTMRPYRDKDEVIEILYNLNNRLVFCLHWLLIKLIDSCNL